MEKEERSENERPSWKCWSAESLRPQKKGKKEEEEKKWKEPSVTTHPRCVTSLAEGQTHYTRHLSRPCVFIIALFVYYLFFPPLSFLWPKHVKLLSLRGWEKAGFKGLRKIKTNTGSFMGPTPTPLAQLLPLSSPLPLHYRYATPPLPLRQRYRYITAILPRRCATDTATLPLYYRYATPTLLLHYH